MAEQVGALVARMAQEPVGQEVVPTVSSLPSTDTLDLTKLPARLDDETMARLRAIAAAPLPIYESCDFEHFARCMRTLALLPRKADDATGGKLRLALFYRKLGEFPDQAWTYLASRAHEELDWFPSVKQARKILQRWPGPENDRVRRSLAKRLIHREFEARYHDLRDSIRRGELTDEQIAALPEKTICYLEEDQVIVGYFDEGMPPKRLWTRRIADPVLGEAAA